MKKLTPVLVAAVALGFTACKKEESASPATLKLKTVSNLKDIGTWDDGDTTVVEPEGMTALRVSEPTSTPKKEDAKPKKSK